MRKAIKLIKEKVNYVDVLQLFGIEYTGGKIACPICGKGTNTPNFSVYDDLNKAHCFTCKFTGDIINFYMEKKSVKIGTAIRELAKEFKIELPKYEAVNTTGPFPYEKYNDPITYDFKDTNGELVLFEERQYLKKQFKHDKHDNEPLESKRVRLGHYDQNGTKIYGLKDCTRRILYNRYEVLKASTVFINEGPKCADLINSLGLCGTAVIGGAKSGWRSQYNQDLKDKNVVILQDNDEPGEVFALKVADELCGVAKTTKILLVSSELKGDIEQFIKDGGTKEKLLQMVRDTKKHKVVYQSSKNKSSGNRDEQRKLQQTESSCNFESIPEIKKIVSSYGKPYTTSNNGRVNLNQEFFPILLSGLYQVLFEPIEKRFYLYAEETGLWKCETESRIKVMLADAYREFFAEILPIERDKFFSMKTDNFLNSCIGLLKGRIEKRNAFSKEGKRFIHVLNGIIDMSEPSKMALKSFSPEWLSRNQLPITFNSKANCPRFINELLKPQMENEDILLLQKYCGCIILGGNPIQRLLILSGNAGTGKGTITEIIELMVGIENTAQLRTQNLTERFELSFYVGKTLLGGKDVPGDFLQHAGAKMIKTLVGHDNLTAEFKQGKESYNIRGEFSCLINCNDRLRVILDGDTEAWRRRLLIISFDKTPVVKKIPNFSHTLFKEEGSGILNWMLLGAYLLLEDIDKYGDIQLTDKQKERTDKLLAESDSLRVFVKENIAPSEYNDLTTEEIINDYAEYCRKHAFRCPSIRIIELQLPDIMLTEFGVQKNSHVLRDGKQKRGYRFLKLKPLDKNP